MIRVAINGYGRIGRVSHRIILEKYKDQIEVAAINSGSSTDLKGWANLLKYDSVYGPLKNNVRVQEGQEAGLGQIIVDEIPITVFSEKDPSKLPWKELNIDVVIESTGHFRKREDLQKHINAGAKAVVLSAPEKDETIPTYVLSVNSDRYQGEKIISNASCTTNCIAPVMKVLEEEFGVKSAMLTTVHGYTSDQNLQDSGHKDYRRARAGAINIIPTSTGATEAAIKALPQLKDKFTGLALRVPVPVGSLSDIVCILEKETTKEEVNNAFKKAGEEQKGILSVTEDPIVSSDLIGNPNSATLDLNLTQVIGNMVKVIAWYDNEYGYANRLIEEVMMIGKNL